MGQHVKIIAIYRDTDILSPVSVVKDGTHQEINLHRNRSFDAKTVATGDSPKMCSPEFDIWRPDSRKAVTKKVLKYKNKNFQHVDMIFHPFAGRHIRLKFLVWHLCPQHRQ